MSGKIISFWEYVKLRSLSVLNGTRAKCVLGKIARHLQDKGVKNCTSYWQERGIGRGGKKVQPNPYKWKSSTIRQILLRQEYCGDVVNFKTYSKSFKNKKRLQNPEEN